MTAGETQDATWKGHDMKTIDFEGRDRQLMLRA